MTDANTYFNRGVAHDELGEYEKAISEYNKAIELERFSARAFYLRGLIYLDQGNVQAAISELSAAIRYGQLTDPETRVDAIRQLVRIRSRR